MRIGLKNERVLGEGERVLNAAAAAGEGEARVDVMLVGGANAVEIVAAAVFLPPSLLPQQQLAKLYLPPNIITGARQRQVSSVLWT